MPWPKQLLIALPAAFLLASCSSSKPPVNAPPMPLPAALAQPCPIPVAATDNSADALALALKHLYDQYGHCAGLHWDTVQHLQKD